MMGKKFWVRKKEQWSNFGKKKEKTKGTARERQEEGVKRW